MLFHDVMDDVFDDIQVIDDEIKSVQKKTVLIDSLWVQT